jgi:imidazolonepropionase-like amidohydrolase
MRRSLVLTLFATAALAGPLAAQKATLTPNVRKYVSTDSSATAIAIVNVQVIDGTGAPAKKEQTVVISGGKITAVGPAKSVKLPSGAKVINGTGNTVIPGLVGLHDHLFYSASGGHNVSAIYTAPRLYLASGVTTIRTTGGYAGYADINLKRNIDAGRAVGPRIYITAPYLTGEGGGGSMAVLTTPEENRRFVAYWAEEGASWIKFYTNVNRENMKAAVDEAKKRGLYTTGHLCAVTFQEAAELGITDLAHGAFTASDFVQGKQPDVCPPNLMNTLDTAVSATGPIAQGIFKTLIDRNVSITSTLPVVEAFYPRRPVTDERSTSLMAPEVKVAYLADRAFIDSAKAWPFTEAGLKKQMAFELAFYKAGGLLGNGVDPTGNGGALPGYGDQRGYELLREAGFTTEQAVQVCTLNGARILRADKEYGSIAVGKAADLVLLSGDLTSSPNNIRNVITTFKNGIGFDPAKLIDDVRGRVGIN